VLSYVTRDGTVWSSEIFSSIPDCFWWCCVTFTTVGYGDVNPRTPWGQALCAAVMFIGIFFLAMPISIVGDSFTTNWNRFTAKRSMMEAQDKHQKTAEEKQAARARGEVIHVDLDGPHDALDSDILAFFVKAKKNLNSLAPAEEEEAAVWATAAEGMAKCEEMWIQLYAEIREI
jgi:hypothetical protein